jgi:hypothetical protein
MNLAEEPNDAEDLLQAVAQAADLCRKPWRHAARFGGDGPSCIGESSDCLVLVETRDADGARQPSLDLELEIYRSGEAHHLMVALAADQQAPLLWHGHHSVWMEAQSGERVERPASGAALEALCRRLQAWLQT